MNNQQENAMGDNSVEARTRRTETRLANFMRWCGYDPKREVAVELAKLVVKDDSGALHATSPAVSIGDIAQAMYRYRMEGDVPLYLNGIQLGTLNVTKNFRE